MQSNTAFYSRRAVQEELRALGAVGDVARERHAKLARTFRERVQSHESSNHGSSQPGDGEGGEVLNEEWRCGLC